MFRFGFALFVIAVVLSAIWREASAQQFNILLPQPGIFIDRDPPRQAKAQGFPKLNANTSLANGLLFYAIDTGLGEYTILADTWPGHYMYPPNYKSGYVYSITGPIPMGSTQWGTGLQFQGSSYESTDNMAFFSYVWDSDNIRNAQNLAYGPAGMGVTIFTTYVQLADSSYQGVIFGRTANGFTEATPSASLLLSTGSANQKVDFWYSQSVSSQATILESPATYAFDQLHTAVGTCLNDSAGSATCRLYVDGVSVVTSPGGQAPIDIVGHESNEGQIMFGGSMHIAANHVSGILNGFVYQGGIARRAWNAQEIAAFARDPWQMMK
jgi:hypothetical protein